MAKFYGPIGFVESCETEPGSSIWEDAVTEISYRGEIIKNTKRWETSEYLNKDINISNTISILADPYVLNHLFAIRYVKWLGSYWEIITAEVQSPRIVLTLGGVYNGPVATTSGYSEEYPRVG